MSDQHTVSLPHTLIEAVKEKRAVLVFGAGASKESENADGTRPPDGNQLRDILAKKYLGKTDESRNLMTVAEMAIANGAGQPQVFEQISKALDGFEPSAAHLSVADFSWRGLATTNYDKLIEGGYSSNKKRKQTCLPFVKDIEPYQDRLDEAANPVALLKLHGCIDHRLDPDVPLILSNEHYHRYLDNRKLLFSRLTDWAQNSVLIFIGYKVEDPHLRSLIYDIDPKRRPQWYIVAPHADVNDVRLWQTFNVDLIQTTFSGFMGELETKVPAAVRSLSKLRKPEADAFQKHFRTDSSPSEAFIDTIKNDLEYIHSAVPFEDIEPKNFYSGYDQGWCGIVRKLDFRRKVGERLLFDFADAEQEEGLQFYLLQGSAGAGKTVALKRAAYDAATSLDLMAFWLKPNGHPRPEFFSELFDLTGKRTILFVDHISLHAKSIDAILSRAAAKGIPLTIVASEREAEWKNYCEQLERTFPPQVYELRNLSEAEAEDLVELLRRHHCLGMLETKPQSEQIAAFLQKDRADRQLLVALHELTLGKPFEEIILEEYQRIIPETARRLYLDIATMHQFGVVARAGAISRISGIRFNDFEDQFFVPLKNIVSVTWDPTTGDHGYHSRHSKVSELVFGVACENDEDKARQLARIIEGLDSGFSSDSRILEGICKGRQLANRFSSVNSGREILEMAREAAPHLAYLFQQSAIYEYLHPHGSLELAEQLAVRAREIDSNNHIYLHTLAEVARRRANATNNPIKKEQLRSQSRKYLNDIWFNRDVRKDLSFCNLLVDEALDVLKSLPDSPKNHEILNFDKKVDEATERLRKAIQEHPDDSEFQAVEAKLWERLGEGEKAESALKRAIQANPRNSGVFLRLAKLRGKRNGSSELLQESIDALEEGLKNFPTDKSIHLQMAMTLLFCESAGSAKVEFHFRSSFTVGDHNFDARFYYAEFLFLVGRVEEAENLFLEIDRRAPDGYRQYAPRTEDVITQKLGRYNGVVSTRRERNFLIQFGGYPSKIFAYWRSLQDTEYDELHVSDPVSFHIRFNRKGPVAVEVCKK